MLINTSCNLLIAGVGGQGSVLIGSIVGSACIKEGLRVWVGETFGMSQRGGSVVSHVRISQETLAPVTPERLGDVILGLEPMETLRVAHKYVKATGKIILNPRPILPSDVISGRTTYPPKDEILGCLRNIAGDMTLIDAAKLAERSGNIMTVNIVMLGALAASAVLPVSFSTIEIAVKSSVPPSTVDVNLKAFRLGSGAFKKALNARVRKSKM